MKKIKIVGAFIFILSVILASLSYYISTQNMQNDNILKNINEKKAFTQEISKTIFYKYKRNDISTKDLDILINNFLNKIGNYNLNTDVKYPRYIKIQEDKIINLWNKFYLEVQHFRDESKSTSASIYSIIFLEKTVKKIYHINLKLVMEFDKLIKMHQLYVHDKLYIYINILYMLFASLVLMLIYLFTQLKGVIAFIQKFLNTSKKIISDSSIQELEPINIKSKSYDIEQASNNFNFLVNKIDTSIKYSINSIEHSSKSLENLESDIEDIMELIYTMEENNDIDLELTKKEDAVIQALEELANSTQKIKNLESDLKNLITYKNLKNI